MATCRSGCRSWPEESGVNRMSGAEQRLTPNLQIAALDKPWVVVVIFDGNMSGKQEWFGHVEATAAWHGEPKLLSYFSAEWHMVPSRGATHDHPKLVDAKSKTMAERATTTAVPVRRSIS